MQKFFSDKTQISLIKKALKKSELDPFLYKDEEIIKLKTSLSKLREEIEYDEGNVQKIYLDHLGLPTFGIGHLVRESDPEYGWEVGKEVSLSLIHISEPTRPY